MFQVLVTMMHMKAMIMMMMMMMMTMTMTMIMTFSWFLSFACFFLFFFLSWSLLSDLVVPMLGEARVRRCRVRLAPPNPTLPPLLSWLDCLHVGLVVFSSVSLFVAIADISLKGEKLLKLKL